MTAVAQKIRKADRTRRALLDAALSVIGRKGYSAATVDEIVREAGVSKGVVYYHFKSKEDIASSILEQEFAALKDEFIRVVDACNAISPEQVLLDMLNVFATHLYDRKALTQFFSAEMWRSGRAWSDGVRSAAQELIDLISVQLKRGQETGTIRKSLDPNFTAASIVGMVVVDALYCLGDDGTPRLSRDEFVERIYDFIHNATRFTKGTCNS